MNAMLVIAVLGAGPYWSIAPDGSLIVIVPPRVETTPVVIVIAEPPSTETLTRLPGPHHPWPHGRCEMCLGNHLIASHGHDQSYLNSIGSPRWGVRHDNDHNASDYAGHRSKPSGQGGYSGGGTGRWQPFRQLFGRFR